MTRDKRSQAEIAAAAAKEDNEILLLFSQGHSAKAIAHDLGIKVNRVYRARLRAKAARAKKSRKGGLANGAHHR